MHLVKLFTSTIPSAVFGFSVQVDAYKRAQATKDVPRIIATDVNFFQTILSYFNCILPFTDEKFLKQYLPKLVSEILSVSKEKLFNFSMFRDGLHATLNFIRTHIMMGFHVVGMLSSNWQGGDVKGGERKEVVERKMLRKQGSKPLANVLAEL